MIDGPISSRVILITGDMVVGDHYVIEEKWPTYTRRRTPSLEEIAQLRSFPGAHPGPHAAGPGAPVRAHPGARMQLPMPATVARPRRTN